MSGYLSDNDIFRAEHEVIKDAQDWIGQNKDESFSELQYLMGVYDMTEKLISKLEGMGK